MGGVKLLNQREKAVYYITAIQGFMRHMSYEHDGIDDKLMKTWGMMLDTARVANCYDLSDEEYNKIMEDCKKESENHMKQVDKTIEFMVNKRNSDEESLT